MNDDEPVDEPHPDPRTTAAERARRRARVFGDILPETTRDERSGGEADGAGVEGADDEWLRSNVPPHYGT